MRKFVKRIFVFGILFFLFDKIFIFFIVTSPEKEVDRRLEMLINGKINKEIIVVGSSRGARNIIAGELEKETKHSTYNLSYPGSDIEFHEFVIKTLTKFNKAPKVILMSVDYPMVFLPDTILNFRLDRLYPLVKYDYINDELVARGEKNKWMSQLFALHRINKGNLDIRNKKFTPLDTILSCGSMPISFQKKGEIWSSYKAADYDKTKELQSKVESFKRIISLCEKKGIQLILVTPPLFDEQNPEFIDRLKELTPKNVKFYHYNSKNTIYRNKAYYYDKTHLNRKGAVIFTNELANYLKDLGFN